MVISWHHIAKLGRTEASKVEKIMSLLEKEHEFDNEPIFLYTLPSITSLVCVV